MRAELRLRIELELETIVGRVSVSHTEQPAESIQRRAVLVDDGQQLSGHVGRPSLALLSWKHTRNSLSRMDCRLSLLSEASSVAVPV